jgi:hypothetical protein
VNLSTRQSFSDSKERFSAWTKLQSSPFTDFANARLLIDRLKQDRLLILS